MILYQYRLRQSWIFYRVSYAAIPYSRTNRARLTHNFLCILWPGPIGCSNFVCLPVLGFVVVVVVVVDDDDDDDDVVVVVVVAVVVFHHCCSLSSCSCALVIVLNYLIFITGNCYCCTWCDKLFVVILCDC